VIRLSLQSEMIEVHNSIKVFILSHLTLTALPQYLTKLCSK